MKKLFVFLIFGMLTACNDVNPSYSMVPGQKPPGDNNTAEKPKTCKLDFAKTCWSETVRKITECLQFDSGKDVFSADLQFCSNDSGKLVAFNSPADMFAIPFNSLFTQIDFKVYPDRVNECFSVTGTAEDFQVQLAATGESVYFKMNQTDLSFSCLDGQEVKLPMENVADCEKAVGPGFIPTVPGLEFGPFTDKGQQGWGFRFRGAPDAASVFKCYH